MRGRKNRPSNKLLAYSVIVIGTILLAGMVAVTLLAETTIYNAPDPAVVSYTFTIYDNNGTDITDLIDQAVISDTITFSIQFTEGWDQIHSVTLVVEGVSADASPGGYYAFQQVIGDITTWNIYFDTTQLNNGEYNVDFYYTRETPPTTYGGNPGSLDVTFSSFSLDWADGTGFLTEIGVDPVFFIVLIIVICTMLGAVTYLFLGRKKRKRGK